jgi:hypothetical protein
METFFGISTITSAHTAAAAFAAGNWYGTMLGHTGYWLRIPSRAPPIGYIKLAADSSGLDANADGMYIETDTTAFGKKNVLAKTIIGYDTGGRWICIGLAGASGLTAARHTTGSQVKKIRLYYTPFNEYVGPVDL